MPNLLRLNSSSRFSGSHSAAVADVYEAHWRAANPRGQVVTRDLADGSVPLITQTTIEGFYAPSGAMTDTQRAATALSDTLIADLQTAETLLLAVPVYNFSVPAALKAWIDQVVRIGHTFAFEDGTFRGLLKTRRAIVACAYGAEGYLAGEPFESANFLQPYLRFLLGFMGIGDVHFVSVQATTADAATVESNVAAARSEIAALAA